MSHCPNCGAEVLAGARFCTYCGTQLTTAAPVAAARMTVPTAAYARADYSVMLLSTGSCASSIADDVLADLCGYGLTEAREIVRNVPITIAQALTEEQAACLSQALTEYGMEVSVFDGTGYRTVSTRYDTVYDNNGNLLTAVAGVLGLIGAANRLSRAMIRRHDYPFAGRPPVFAAPRAPRRSVAHHHIRQPEPMMGRPAPHAPMPAPQQHHAAPSMGRPNSGSAPRPMGGSNRPAGGPGGHGGPGGPGGHKGPGPR